MIPAPIGRDQHNIHTSDNVVLGMPVAGIGSRFFADLLDLVIFTIVEVLLLLGFGAVLGAIFPSLNPQYIALILASLGYLFMVTYFAVLEGLGSGRTPGKRWLGTRAIMFDGSALTFTAALIRNITRPLEFALAPLTFVIMFFSPQSRRLGDIAAGTIVVRERTATNKLHQQWQPGAPRANILPATVALTDPGPTIVGIDDLGGHELGTLQTYFARSGVNPIQRTRIAASLSARLLDRLKAGPDAPERTEPPELFLQRLFLQLERRQHL